MRDSLRESETWLAARVLAAALREHTVTWCCAQVRGTGGGLWCLGFVTNDTELSRSMAATIITPNMEHLRHTHHNDYAQQWHTVRITTTGRKHSSYWHMHIRENFHIYIKDTEKNS